MTAPVMRARRCAVAVQEPLAPAAYDYADAFSILTRPGDVRGAEQWARKALEEAPLPLRLVVRAAQRGVLRLRLHAGSSSEHVLGWHVETSAPNAVRLTADGPLLQGVIVARTDLSSRMTITTFICYHSMIARAVWRLIAPLHRGVAPRLLELAASP